MIGRTSSWIGTQKPMWNRSFAGLRWGASGQAWNPRTMGSLSARYDISDLSSLIYDGSNRVSLVSDKSGNSAVNCLVLNGVAGNYASTPDSAAVSVTGDITLVTYCAPNDWTPSANQLLVSKYNSSSGNHRSYWLRQLTTGALNFNWSADGATATAINSTATIGSADFAPLWVAVAFDANNGSGGNDCRFYTSTDGLTWTQLGATVTTAGVASIFDGPATINIGANDAGAFGNFLGKIYRTQIYSGIPAAFGGSGGTLVFDANFATASKLATSFTESSSNAATVTINTSGATGARISGERDLYQGTVANQPILTIAASGNHLTFDGSNDYLKAPAFALSQPETVYFCGSQVSWTLNRALMDGNNSSTNASQIYAQTASPRVTMFVSADGPTTTGFAVGAQAVVTALWNGSASTLRINRGSAATGNPGTASMNGFTLGSSGVGTSPANITASEIIIYSAAHTTAQQDRVIQHLSRKWKIAV